MSNLPATREKLISQIPALQLLINLGWEYLTPEEALAARGGKTASVLLDRVLEDQLRAMNRIEFRGHSEPFSEGNIATAIRRLKDERFDGLIRTNEKLYDRLTLGTTLSQTIAGDTKSFPLHYIDWKNPANNRFHVTAEFEVARTGSQETRRPDIVLFINGIPVAVIENKSPNAKVEGGSSPVEQAISQMLRNQGVHEIPRLFGFVQLVLALAVGEAKYATVGTSAKYWAVWKEENLDEDGPRGTCQPTACPRTFATGCSPANSPRPAAISTSSPRSEAAKSPSRTAACTRSAARNGCWSWPSDTCCSTAATRKSPDTSSTSVSAGFWTGCSTAKRTAAAAAAWSGTRKAAASR